MSKVTLDRRSLMVASLAGSTLWLRAGRSTDASSKNVDQMVCPPSSPSQRKSEAAIIELKDGRLLLAYTDFYTVSSDDDAPAQINAKYSNDMGRTWSEPCTIVKNTAKMNVMSVSLIRLKSGEIAMAYMFKESDEDCAILFRTSRDEARTFRDPVKITARRSFWVMNNDRLVQLSSGRLLAPCQRLDNWPIVRHSLAEVFYSDDDGKTWHESALVDIRDNNDGADEPGVIELKDGRILMYFRTALGSIYQCFSSDQGLTWTEPVTMRVAAPVSPSIIKRIPSTGDLLMIWNHTLPHPHSGHTDRFPLTAAISKDEARTWEKIQDIGTDVSYIYGYPSITFSKDRVLISYWAAGIFGYWIGLRVRSMPVQQLYNHQGS